MSPDYEQLSFEALTLLLNATPGVPNHEVVPKWSGPDSSIIQAQSILFASLASALLAAFLMMLGKQWLNLHVEGSFIDRNRHREIKMRGMITWKFKFVMDCLPLIMQFALFLLMAALARYFWDLSRTVSSVIIAFTLFGLTFYLFIVVAATYSKACPFQTPASIALRVVIHFCRGHIAEVTKYRWSFFGPNRGPTPHQNVPLPNPLVPDIDEQENGIGADSKCITTMFRMTKAPQSITAIMAYIPEITWDERIKSIPLLQVYRALRESLWRSADGKALLQPGARERALGSAKALLHLYIQRRCIYGVDQAFTDQVQSIGHPRQALWDGNFDGDSDLQSTFYVVDWAFGVYPEIPWSKFQLSEPHHCWLSHILLYRAWETLQNQGELSDDVKGFLKYSLACDTLPSRVVADCVFIINMIAGHRPPSRELLNKDRRLAPFVTLLVIADARHSHQIASLIDEVFNRIETTFTQSGPSDDIAPSIKALQLVVLLREEHVCVRSYALFRTLIPLSKNDARMWEAADLSMRGTHSSTETVPPVGDLQDILDFLRFHVSPQKISAASEDPIYHAFRSIVLDSSAGKRRKLAACTYFGSSSFIDALIQLLGRRDHKLLQKTTLLILPELDDVLFASKALDDPKRAKGFVSAWSTAIDEFIEEVTPPEIEVAGVLVLLAIANSQSLRALLPSERWRLAYSFPNILYLDSPSMERCIQNPDILPFIKAPDTNINALGWLGMLWMNYHDSSDEVRRQLEDESRAICSGPRHYDLNTHASLFDVELERLQAKIDKLQPLDQSALPLRSRLDEMKRAKDRLLEIQNEGELVRNQASRTSLQPGVQRGGLQTNWVLGMIPGIGGAGGTTG